MDEVLVEIDGKNTMPEFTETCAEFPPAKNAPSMWSIRRTPDQRLAGKTFIYTVKVQRVKQKTLPELNDDFAKELGANSPRLKKFARASAKAWKPSGSTPPSTKPKTN